MAIATALRPAAILPGPNARAPFPSVTGPGHPGPQVVAGRLADGSVLDVTNRPTCAIIEALPPEGNVDAELDPGLAATQREALYDMRTDRPGNQPTRVAVVINPRSGSTRHHRSADDRRVQAERLFRDHGIQPVVWMTERAGHARELAQRALDEGFEWVFAWGGDGTVNEVASVLAFSPATMSVIPSGSGNGLAREFGIPRPPDQAVRAAVEGRDATIDAGEIDGRLFFNVAGLGFDAHVAQCFSTAIGGRRGTVPYFWTTVREALRYKPQPMTIDTGGERIIARPLLVAVANGRQWGSGARIAPRALPDDGRLELVVVSGRWPPTTLLGAWRLFTGTFDRASAARSLAVESITIHSDVPIAIHVDGEPIGERTDVIVRVRPSALKLRIPRHRRQ